MTEGPISRAAEEAVIGAVLSPDAGGHAYDAIAGTIGAEDFSAPLHALAWGAVENMTAKGRPASVMDVAEELDTAHPALAPTLATLGPMVRELPSTTNVMAYAERIAQSARARRLLHALNAGGQRLAGARRGGELPELCEDVLGRVTTAYDDRGQENMVGVKDAVKDTLAAIEERFERVGDDLVDGLHSGFASLDSKTGGLRAGELIVVGARPSVGKTSLAMNIAAHVAATVPVVVFTLEMPTDQITLRLLAAKTRLRLQSVRTGKLTDSEYGQMAGAIQWAAGLKMHIDDSVNLSALDLTARARRVQRQHGLGLIVIDYLQLLRMSGETRTRAVGETTRTLKNAAKTLGVPILLLSQLNREAARRGSGKPTLSDLRDSGEIEQDADVVALLHREDIGKPDDERDGQAELILAKARNGETGNIMMNFSGPSCAFDDDGFAPNHEATQEKWNRA